MGKWLLGCVCYLCTNFVWAEAPAQVKDKPQVVIDDAYELAAVLTLETVANLQGGLDRGSRQLANFDLTFALDTESAGWWSGGEWFVYVLGDYGRNPSDLTGDLQGLSNIAADNNLSLYEFWYRHRFANDSFQVLVGLHDYNSSYYSLDSAGLFTLSSFGIGADTAQVGPSIFPVTALSVQVSVYLDNQYLLVGVYDGVPGDPARARGTHIKFGRDDGIFSALEWGLQEEQNYKVALGFWQHTALVENPITSTSMDNNSGAYFIAEKYFQENLVVFLQLGQADDERNQLEDYAGAGVVRNDAWRSGDSVGLAVAHARNGSPFLLENPDVLSAETAWEFSYFTPVDDFLSLQASVYYINHPAMDPALADALAVGTRVYINS